MRRSRFEENLEPVSISWGTLKSLIPYLLEFRRRIALAMGCLVAAKLASVGLPFLLKYIVDALALEASPVLTLPLGLLLAYGAARFANVVFGEIRDTLFGRVTERAMRRLGLKVFRHLHALDLEFHLNRHTGGLARDIERGVSGVSFLMRFMVFNIGPTFLEIGLVVGLLLWNYDLWFALITLVAVILYVGFSVIATEWRTGFVREANLADSTSNSRAVDSLLNFETVKYFGNEEWEAQQYDRDLATWEMARRKNRLSLFALNGGQALIVAAAMTGMMVLAGHNVVKGEMTVGDFVLINAFMMQLFMPLNFLGFVYREMKGSLANIERMFKLLHRTPGVCDKEDAVALKSGPGELRFDNVHFHYQPERPILKGLSFSIKPGQTLAIVGPSGAGKSTIVKCLYRFYDLQEGRILIDGTDISTVTQATLRRQLAIVPQDTVLFNSSIEQNVRYGRIDASDAEVDEAIRLAHLESFIDKLPRGKETIVGERGLKLSGGEKQRVAIARAILKRSALMVFDEATSSLDTRSERAILKAIQEVAANHTSLIIAHRLSTVVHADQIVVLQDGVIAEQGTHQALLQAQGLYARLWEAQSRKQSDRASSAVE